MTTTSAPLFLERPAFWTENNDPEAWFRALKVMVRAIHESPQAGTPRTVAERCLVGVIAWRGAMGLFGPYARHQGVRLAGVGLLALDDRSGWVLTDEAQAIVRTWKQSPFEGLELLAELLVRESPWLRLLLLRMRAGDWALVNWAGARSARAGLQVGRSLQLRRHAAPETWFTGLEPLTAGRWLARTGSRALAYAPDVLERKQGKDNLSLTPLTAPLHLLESVGWLSPTGELALPSAVLADLVGTVSPAQALTDISRGQADVRGFVAAEPVLRDLLATFGLRPPDEAFARWMDALMDAGLQRGALEVLAAEPGQARHGRGLQADPKRKLVRWVVHANFDEVFESVWPTLETKRELTS